MMNRKSSAASVSEDYPYLKQLNSAQQKAVEHGDGPLLVFAGAGSGKTRVLTYRILHLVQSGKARPESIFAVTFTNKAAREMKERVLSLLGGYSGELWVSTFHSSCVRILRSHAHCLGFSRDFAIYDRNDSIAALKRVMKRRKVDPRIISPRSLLTEIDRAKNNYLDSESLREKIALTQSQLSYQSDYELICDLYAEYQNELLQCNAMDFGDLLCNTVSLFSLNPKVLQSYQERFRHILVDEYQDTNPVQYLLIRQLSQRSQNLCVVGDDDQSIYAFRGASIENILSFQEDFPECACVTLDTNYRSTKTILKAANAVIAKNNKRQAKTLITDNPEGEAISCYCADNEQDEARFVADKITEARAAGIPYSDIAVFYRTNAQSRAFEEALSSRRIPFTIFGGVRFYERKEIRDVLAYFRLLLNPKDNESFLRIINTPTRGIGATSIQKLQAFALRQETSLFEALSDPGLEAALGRNVAKKFQTFIKLIAELNTDLQVAQAAVSQPEPPADYLAVLLHAIAQKSGYLAELQKENTEESLARIENLQELFAVAQESSQQALREGEEVSLRDFLDRASLISDLDSENTTGDETADEQGDAELGTVSMMTLHLAKGLEFRHTFLVGMEDGLLPHIRSLDTRADLEEERRLCYVGITRGKEKLYLTRCLERGSFNRGRGWSSGIASRFVADIPQECTIDCGGFFSSSSWEDGFGM